MLKTEICLFVLWKCFFSQALFLAMTEMWTPPPSPPSLYMQIYTHTQTQMHDVTTFWSALALSFNRCSMWVETAVADSWFWGLTDGNMLPFSARLYPQDIQNTHLEHPQCSREVGGGGCWVGALSLDAPLYRNPAYEEQTTLNTRRSKRSKMLSVGLPDDLWNFPG